MSKINFAGIVDSSTIDYPNELCAVVYLCGCSFRCPWCQNLDLVLEKGACRATEIDEILALLKENFLINAVCITGGEPLMQKETLKLLKKIKAETKLKLKIDTNGYFPKNLEMALTYLDFLTMDVKAPLNETYGRVVGLPFQWKQIVKRVEKSLKILKIWQKDKEARTTIVPNLIDKEKDIKEIAKVVKKVGFSLYTLQQFRAERTLKPEYEKLKSPTLELMQNLGKIAKKELPKIKVRIVTQQNGFEEIK